MIKFLAKACRLVLATVRSLAKTVEERGMPPQMNMTMEQNIIWGTSWIAGTVGALAAGEAVQVSPNDLIMLLAAVASVVLARRRVGGRQAILHALT